jgi:rRNA maturation RNase YbeY
VGVELRCDSASARRFAGAVRADAAKLLAALRLDSAELSIVLTADRAIRALNRRYLGKDSPTDVISFPQLDLRTSARGLRHVTDGSMLALGDVVISADTARRQARALGVATAARLRTLLIHGVLHLLGYDHERSAADARRMFSRERALARALGDGGRRRRRR